MINVSQCIYCNGRWINKDEFTKLVKNENNDFQFNKTLESNPQKKAETNKNCPECVNKKLYKSNDLEICGKCGGVFLNEEIIKEILPNSYMPRYMNAKKEDELKKHLSISFMGTALILLTMIFDELNIPGTGILLFFGFILAFYGGIRFQIRYHKK
jgi:Zn-finger nucleic acid-binding protein